ncbi:Acg family FMN-binding oxidoreductase [Streptomyces sp. NPDC018610]|uniref:Acg family FMN-binding oxidoreductase n=1 Tax=Streptomyces sp. NPDC018610 TaxID=3365049 RepID=UPI0037A3BA12
MPTRQLDARTVTALVADATTAPSMHNAQPWRFRYLAGPHALLLLVDTERAMHRTDPDGRALHIGCGAALLNLRAAAAHAGLIARVRPLPDPADPLLLAEVRFGHDPDGAAPGAADLRRLYPYLARRHTSRYPFEEEEPPAPVRAALRAAAAREGAELLFPGPWHIDAVLELVHDAESRDALDPSAAEDLTRWTRRGPWAASAVDGVPEYAFGPTRRDGKAPLRDFAGRHRAPGRDSSSFEEHPRLAVLSTPGDRPADWLVAGQALERVLLEATAAGLATSLTSHPLESPDLRLLARDPVSGHGHVQMVLRLGYGPPGPATPRRPVTDVLEVAEAVEVMGIAEVVEDAPGR